MILAILVLKNGKNTKFFFKELIKITKKLKNLINKLYFRIYIIFRIFIIFFRCTKFGNRRLSRDSREIKWMVDLPNVNLFLERIREKDETIKPTSFFYDSESYFEHLFL